jgi:peptide/nickel transport system substrate-binding protein
MSRTTMRRRLALVAGAAAVILGLTACTGGGSTDGDGGDDGAEHVYIEGISADPTGFNPQVAGGPNPLRFGYAILGTLVEMTDDYKVSPGLVESWEFSDDGLTVTMKVRQGVTWHDGEPFTAEDVKFNLEEMVPLTGTGAPLAATFDSVTVEDEETVVVKLKSVYGPFMEALSQQAVVPKHLYEGTDYVTNPANMAPVGTGALKFESFSPGSEVVLVKNPDWWKGETDVDRAIFPIMTDQNARTLSLLSGELDAAVIDPSQQDQVTNSENLELMQRGSFTQMISVTFNSRSPELTDPEVRRLIFAAMDRDKVTELGVNGLGSPAQGYMPDTMSWAQNADIDFDSDFPRDIEAIEEGLDDAGYPVGADGWRMTLDVNYISALSDVAATAEVLKASLEEVGIQLNLVGTAEPVFIDNVFTNPTFDLSLLRNTAGADPSVGISVWLTCNSASAPFRNGSGVCDSELDEAATGAVTNLDRDVRAEYLGEMQERANELMYWAPLTWTNASFNTVNTERWSHLADGQTQTNSPPWAEMEWQG